MPGDTAVLSIDLQNGEAQYGAGAETLTGTLSTPINGTTLRGTNEIAVISPDYKDIGMIGPTDKITLYYKIKANDNISNSNGTYFLDFGVSGGEKQRVAIARALANDPKIIIADEPTGNLDLKSSDEVMNIMKKLHDEGRTIIMVTHNPEITENCNRVIRLRDGRILGEAS